jgi:ABC-type multidrug transport system ATPase subunit
LSYSGGERQRCKLADILSFSKLIGKFNFLILDEVLELSLDSNGIDKIFELLKTRALELDTIFVVSHNNQLNDKFDSILTIRKNNGNSEVI